MFREPLFEGSHLAAVHRGDSHEEVVQHAAGSEDVNRRVICKPTQAQVTSINGTKRVVKQSAAASMKTQ